MTVGEKVTITTFLDANYQHDLTTGRPVTAVLHFLNMTPVDWFSKWQECETAQNLQQEKCNLTVYRYCTTLHYLEVPITDKMYMFGDTNYVVTSAMLTHSALSKSQKSLAHH